jgi:hypothetical protein
MPTGDVYEQLERILHQLSSKHGAPEFPAHVTLLGGIVGPRREVLRECATLTALIGPSRFGWRRLIISTNISVASSFARRSPHHS